MRYNRSWERPKTRLEQGPGLLSDYYDWFKSAEDGDVLVYFTGDLARARDAENFKDSPEFQQMEQGINALHAVATRVQQDAKAKHIALTQKRIGESHYEYRATRRRRNPVLRIEYEASRAA